MSEFGGGVGQFSGSAETDESDRRAAVEKLDQERLDALYAEIAGEEPVEEPAEEPVEVLDVEDDDPQADSNEVPDFSESKPKSKLRRNKK